MSTRLTKEEMKKIVKVETCEDLFNYMKYDPKILVPLIKHISGERWQCVSSKYKVVKNRMTVHTYDGDVSKPLYFDSEMNIHESGKRASDEVQKVLKSKIMDFIKINFKEKEEN